MHGEMVLPHQVNSCWTWTAGTVYSSWMTSRGCRQQRDKAGGASMAAEILAAPLIHPPRVLQAKALNHTHVAVLCQLMTPCRWILVGSSVGRRSIWRLWILNIERPSLLFDLQLLRIQPFMYAFPMDSSSASTSQRLVLARKKNDRTVGVNLYRRVWARRVDVCSYVPRRVDAHAPFRDCRFVLVRFGFVTAQFWVFRFWQVGLDSGNWQPGVDINASF